MMDLRESLFRHVLIPGFESVIKRRPIFAYWKALDQSQWLSIGELRERQHRALRALLDYAEAFCPYYRDTWMARGLRAAGLTTPEDFERWPVTTKDDIRRHRLRMRTQNPGVSLLAKATGGSTGAPVHFDLDHGSYNRRLAAWNRGYAWAGAAPGTKQLYLWGVAVGQRSWRRRVKDDVYNRLYRRKIFNTFQLSDAEIPKFVALLNQHRPDAIVAYANPLYAVARQLDAQDIRPFSPRTIVVGAEKLHDFQRALIQRVFQAPVFETYGSREFMLMAAECEQHSGLHVTMEHLLVEVLDDSGRPVPPGVEGNIVVTDLYNFGMPFIRYETGDRGIAAAGACGCGRGLPRLQAIVGRRLDILTTPDGRLVPGEFFPHLLKEFPAISNFQVLQQDPRRIEITLVTSPEWAPEDERRLTQEVRGVIGPVVELDLRYVADIPLTAAGKRRVVLNTTARLETDGTECASYS